MTSTGYSVVDNKENVILSGKIETKKDKFESEDERINYIVDEIKNIIKKYENKIELVGIENQFISSRTATIMVLRKLLGAVCRMVYKECSIKTVYLAPTTVKKIITGSGRAKKDEVAKYIQENCIDIGEYSDKTGKKKTSDIYDAIGIAIAVGREAEC